jgi:Ser/Thr protein kinase RdoA (MazF antagonist)
MGRAEIDEVRQAPTHGSLVAIVEAFEIPSPVGAIEPYGRGLINDTFRVEAGGACYVLQRINGAVFPDPLRIMSNIQALDRQARQHADLGFRVPALIATRGGDAGLGAPDGSVWRLMTLIEDARSMPRIETLGQAREVGRLLGRFHTLLQSLPPETMGLTLPGFHDTPAYLARLLSVLARIEGAPDDPEVETCVRFVMDRQALARRLSDARDRAEIPVRVIHGDPKLDNILFDRGSGRALALIDLDTLQPGLILHDIGDCLRSCCNRSGESAHGRTGVLFDLAIAEPILQAYAEQTRAWLSPEEIALIPEAIRLMPFELGLRFLTDHLEGDRYFKVAQPGENLRKAGIQFALVTDIEDKAEDIEAMVSRCFHDPTDDCSLGSSMATTEQMTAPDARLLSSLTHLAELLARIGHPRAAEVADQVALFPEAPERVRHRLDANDWWAGAGSLAAETMADNPGLAEEVWRREVREFRELMIEIGEGLQAEGAANPGISSWLLAFNNWNASEV